MKRKKNALLQRNLLKFRTNRLALLGLFIIVFIILASLLAPFITTYSPTFIDASQKLQQPSQTHLFGTDRLGRDILTRLLYGGRVSIFVALTSAVLANGIGVILGCVSGYYGGKADAVAIYISEIFSAFPITMLILILVGFVGQGISNLIIIFALTGWTGSLRIVRSRILSLKKEAFVESCRANGIGGISIMFRHLLPNTLGPVIVNITLATAGYVLAESGLSFLGLGVPTDIPTWGNIINAARSLEIIKNYPMLWLAPGVAISLFVLGVNFLGDGLRDVFDPAQ